ncbi:MAG: 6-bladed beta-propeller, partial [Cyclobacteriaceae bacterium]|nr:6-bladed beta-propeller [Cyclobacteriaceae bacterium]
MRKLLFFILILFSCQAKDDFDEDFIQIDLSSAKESVNNLSDFFSSVEYVMLEDSDDNPLVQPYKIVSFDSLIFVEDQELDNLLIYNRSGDFLFALNSSDSGPKEFNQIEDYQVSENSIIIKDNILMKFIEFDFSGNFVQESKHQL